MPDLTLFEMLRLGGVPTYLSFILGIVIGVLVVLGYAVVAPYARRRPHAPFVKAWAWAILICGLVCAFNGGVGTVTGLANVYRAAHGVTVESPTYALAQGSFEVLFNVAFGFMFAFLAVFGFATMRLAASREKE
jgi:hypothetical protein